MRLVELGRTVRRRLELNFMNSKVKAKKINDNKMLELAGRLKTELPDCGFALLAFDIENGETCSNYVSNLTDEFMIKALEVQLNILKSRNNIPLVLEVKP